MFVMNTRKHGLGDDGGEEEGKKRLKLDTALYVRAQTGDEDKVVDLCNVLHDGLMARLMTGCDDLSTSSDQLTKRN
jgi:hypothetical protein